MVDNFNTFEVLELRRRHAVAYKKELEMEAVFGWGMLATCVLNGNGIGFLPEFIFEGNEKIEKVDLNIPPIEYAICAF